MTESAGVITPSEPDGRVLGAPTTLRFALLALLFVAGGAGLSVQIADVLAAGRVDNSMGCALADGLNPEAGTVIGAAGADLDSSSMAAWQACEDRYVPHTGWVPFVVVPLLVLAAVVVYLVLPWWKGRRLVAVERVDRDGRLRRDLDDLVALAGVAGPVRFAVVPGALRPGAVVFGTRRRPVVRMTSGLTVTHRADPDRFRAIVLHELAHIRNGDIPVTYATVALWRVFLAAVLLPAACALVYELRIERYPAAWHVASLSVFLLVEEALIVVMVYLARADVLRTREMHADLTAVRLWRVRPEELRGEPPPDERTPAGPRRVLAAAGELWKTHPSWPRRRRVLVAPDALFGTGVLPMFSTGLIADIFADQVGALLPSSVDVLATVRILLVAGLITAIGGVAVWRAVRYARVWDRPAPSGWATGFWLGAGLAVGDLATESTTAGRWLLPHPEAVAILIAVVMLLMAWVAEYASLHIGKRGGRSSLAGMCTGLVPAWLALACVLTWWGTLDPVYGWIFTGADLIRGLGVPADHAPLLVWIVTFLPFLPGRELASLSWSLAFLWLLPLMRARPPGLGRTMRLGLLGGALACAGLLAGRLAVDTVRPLDNAGVTVAGVLSWILIVSTGAMLVTAMVVGASARSHPLISALIASVVAALVGTLAAFLQIALAGCLGPVAPFTAGHCSFRPDVPAGLLSLWPGYVLGAVVLVCLGAAAVAHAARPLLRRRRPVRSTTPETPVRPRHRRFAVAVVVIATVGLVAFDTLSATAAPRSTFSASSIYRGGPAASAETARLQMDAWVTYGGNGLMRRIVALAGTTLPDVLKKISGARDADVQSVRNRVVPPACTALIRLAGDADRYFRIPVPAGRQNWTDAVAALDDGARACHRFQRTRAFDAVFAAYMDVLNAEEASDLVAAWIGPAGHPPGTQPLVASSSEYQPLLYHGVTFRFTTANLAVHPSGPGTGRVATLNIAVCLAAIPGRVTVTGGPPQLRDWRLVFPDGRRVAPVRKQPPGVDASPYPPAPLGAFNSTGDCAAGLVTFDVPAAERGDPRAVEFASPKTPGVLAWSPPRDPSTQIYILGTAQRVTAGDPPGWTAVTGYAIRTAGPNPPHPLPAARVATLTVVTCGSGAPTTIAAARRPWKLLLADGLAVSPVRSPPSDRTALYPNGRAHVGTHAGCRTGSIPFAIPATDTSNPVTINYDTPHAHAFWPVTPTVR